MAVTYTADMDDGVKIELRFKSVPAKTEEAEPPGAPSWWAQNVEVKISVSQRGNADQPSHWTPKYREEQEINFFTSIHALREFVDNLEKLI